MKPVEFYFWWLPPDAWHKTRHLSSWRMSRAEAERQYPGAEPDLSTLEVRNCPETPEELKAIDSGALHTAATAHRRA